VRGQLLGLGPAGGGGTLASVERLLGGARNDVIISNGSGDFRGGGGNDVFFAALSASEILDGGSGIDTLNLESSDEDFVLDMTTGETPRPGQSYIGFEHVTSGGGGDVITGNAADNTLFGGRGVDNLDGRGGQDLLIGSIGDDVLVGGNHNDRLFGNTGDDTLEGDDGEDRLSGGDGNDDLIGGNGNDVFAFLDLNEGGDDAIVGFVLDEDLIDMTATGLGFAEIRFSMVNATDSRMTFGTTNVNLLEIAVTQIDESMFQFA
jgi:Ca2+-binding RTX toxin-like protein